MRFNAQLQVARSGDLRTKQITCQIDSRSRPPSPRNLCPPAPYSAFRNLRSNFAMISNATRTMNCAILRQLLRLVREVTVFTRQLALQRNSACWAPLCLCHRRRVDRDKSLNIVPHGRGDESGDPGACTGPPLSRTGAGGAGVGTARGAGVLWRSTGCMGGASPIDQARTPATSGKGDGGAQSGPERGLDPAPAAVIEEVRGEALRNDAHRGADSRRHLQGGPAEGCRAGLSPDGHRLPKPVNLRRPFTSKLPATAVQTLNNDMLPTTEVHGARTARRMVNRPTRHITTTNGNIAAIWTGTNNPVTKTGRDREQAHSGLENAVQRHCGTTAPHYAGQAFPGARKKTWIETTDEMQQALDKNLDHYNTEHPHQRRKMKGRQTTTIFIAGIRKPQPEEKNKSKKNPPLAPTT